MNFYKAKSHYTRSEGLQILCNDRLAVVIHGESTNEIESIARVVLSALNAPYLKHKAMTDENNLNCEMGIITHEEKEKKQQWIDSQF